MELYAQIACAMPRDPRMRAAGPLARLVYIEAALYCRENLTDGVINRLNLPDFAVDVPAKRKHIDRLTELGALELVDVGWRIPLDVWRRWNPLKSEVDAKRQAEAERKQSYRDKKRRDASVPTGQRVAGWDTRKQPKPKPKPEEELPPQDHSLANGHTARGIEPIIANLAEGFRA